AGAAPGAAPGASAKAAISVAAAPLSCFIDVAARRAFDRGSFHVAYLGLVEIPDGEMHRAAVVPQHEIVLPPLVAIDELRARRVLREKVEQRPALLRGEPH